MGANTGDTVLVSSADQTRQVGQQLAQALEGGENLLLYGDLGAGKTTLVQGLAQGFRITESVKSPTYTYLHEYKIPLRSTRLAHFDLHRLPENPTEQELGSLELFERLADPDTVTVVEWAERLEGMVEERYLPIRLKEVEEGRQIELPKPLRGRVTL